MNPLQTGILLVINYQREFIGKMAKDARALPEDKERETVLDICAECAQLIEGSRMWAMDQIKEKANVTGSSS